MAGIFVSEHHDTKRITLASASLTYDGDSLNVPLFLIGITIQYQQQSTPYYSLNPDGSGFGKLVVKGQPFGTMQCTGIVAEEAAGLDSFFEKVATSCGSGITMVLTPSGGCGGTTTNWTKYTLDGVDMDALTLQLQAGQQGVAVLNQQLNFSFTYLTLN